MRGGFEGWAPCVSGRLRVAWWPSGAFGAGLVALLRSGWRFSLADAVLRCQGCARLRGLLFGGGSGWAVGGASLGRSEGLCWGGRLEVRFGGWVGVRWRLGGLGGFGAVLFPAGLEGGRRVGARALVLASAGGAEQQRTAYCYYIVQISIIWRCRCRLEVMPACFGLMAAAENGPVEVPFNSVIVFVDRGRTDAGSQRWTGRSVAGPAVEVPVRRPMVIAAADPSVVCCRSLPVVHRGRSRGMAQHGKKSHGEHRQGDVAVPGGKAGTALRQTRFLLGASKHSSIASGNR